MTSATTTTAVTGPAAPPAVDGRPRVRVDCFCRCGQNLHGQPIARDPSCGVLVCRCPACGAPYAAGEGLDAKALWLSRLGTALLVAWVLAVLGGYGAAVFGLCGLQAWAADLFDESVPSSRQGEAVICLILTLPAALALGMGIAVAHWHVPWRWQALVSAAVPLAATGLIGVIELADQDGSVPEGASLLVACAAQIALVLAGTAVGRPVARAVVRSTVPPAARAHLAFLWRADGLEPPPVNRAAAE
ncbi:MAG TPA: hypothetical protein VK324_12295 [Tepidisphaeraceae bacterium]|nr:hypothetical protein [Tepidisphaeraceae bacterium]